MVIQEGTIPNGLDDIVKYLDLDPSKTLVLYSTSFGDDTEDGKKRKFINRGRFIYSEVMTYSSCKENGVKVGVCYLDDNLLDYYDEVGLAKKENVIRVNDGNKIEYPFNSVSYMFNKRLKEDENLRKQLDGYTIYSPYISDWDVESCSLINGKLIMDKEEQLKFNSKYYLRSLIDKYSLCMPDGINFNGLKNFEKVLNAFKEKYKEYGNTCGWIKLESQIGGTGNIKFSLNEDVIKIEAKILKMAKQIFDEEYIVSSLPLSFEIDINSLHDEELVCNIGVEGILANDKVTILGGVAQSVAGDGSYLGSVYCDQTNNFIEMAKETAKKVFIAYDKEGYRGFITVDVLVTKNLDTNELKGYAIDPNARFSAGTMLLKAIHAAEVSTGNKVYGCMFSNLIKLSDKSMDNYKKCASPYLFEGRKTNHLGIYPTLMNNVSDFGEGKSYVQTISVSSSYFKAKRNFDYFKDKIEEL